MKDQNVNNDKLCPALRRIITCLSQRWVVMLAIFAVMAAVRIDAIYHHDELIADETYSLMLAQHNLAYVMPLPGDSIMTGREIQRTLTASHPLADDLGALYINNIDIPHASLYYMALRLCVGGMTQYSAPGLARRGGWLNMLFFAVTFYALCRLIMLMFRRSRHLTALMAAGTLAAFAGSSAVECTQLVREYQMAQMMIVLMCWAAAAIAVRLSAGTNIKPALWCALIAATAGALSTGYLNALIITMIYGWIVIAALIRHRPHAAVTTFLSGMASLVLAWGMYLGFFNFLLHSTIHTEYAFGSPASVPGIVFTDCICNGMFTPAGLALLALLLLVAVIGPARKQLVAPSHMPWLPLMALAAMLLVEYASVLHALRYVFPMIPILALILPLVINALPRQWCIIGASAAYCLWLSIIAITHPVRITYRWEQITRELKNGATLYDLNANELPQIAPMVNPDAEYHLTDSLPTDTSLPVITRIKPAADRLESAGQLTGPLRIYRFKK